MSNLDLYLSPGYWTILALTLLLLKMGVRFRWGDFRSISCLFLAQYVAHAIALFGLFHDVTIFVVAFASIFAFAMTALRPRRSRPRDGAQGHGEWMDRIWFPTCRAFLVGYWSARLVLYPFVGGALDMGARLQAQEDHRILFFLSLAYLPAFSACVYRWMSYRMRLFDYLALAVTLLGVYGSGSKSAFLPLLLVFVGVASMIGVRWRSIWVPTLLILGGAVTVLMRLAQYFPTHSVPELLNLFLYRVFSNSDSLEYLAALGVHPSAYPYSGLGALVPFAAPVLDYEYGYSPGVWLFGSVFGDWSGHGPNSGMVMDYFGNLSWWGLLVAPAAAMYLRLWEDVGGSVGASFLAIAYLLFVDITIFQVAFAIWFLVFAILALAPRLFDRSRSEAKAMLLRNGQGPGTRPVVQRPRHQLPL